MKLSEKFKPIKIFKGVIEGSSISIDNENLFDLIKGMLQILEEEHPDFDYKFDIILDIAFNIDRSLLRYSIQDMLHEYKTILTTRPLNDLNLKDSVFFKSLDWTSDYVKTYGK